MQDRSSVVGIGVGEQAAGLRGRNGDQLDAPSFGFGDQVIRDREGAILAGAHDQPATGPRDLFGEAQRRVAVATRSGREARLWRRSTRPCTTMTSRS